MLTNRANQAIPQTVIDAVTTKLNEIKAALAPYMISLTDDDRKELLKMSDKSEAFVSKVVNYTDSNPEFTPQYLDKADLKIDYENCKKIDPILKLSQQVCDGLSDTRTVCGSEAFLEALAYYNSVKSAEKNGVTNAGTVYQDLSQRFPGRKGAKVVAAKA